MQPVKKIRSFFVSNTPVVIPVKTPPINYYNGAGGDLVSKLASIIDEIPAFAGMTGVELQLWRYLSRKVSKEKIRNYFSEGKGY